MNNYWLNIKKFTINHLGQDVKVETRICYPTNVGIFASQSCYLITRVFVSYSNPGRIPPNERKEIIEKLRLKLKFTTLSHMTVLDTTYTDFYFDPI